MESSFRNHTRWPIGRKLEGFHHNRAPPRRMFAALPSQPSVTLALKLARICGVTVEDIFTYQEDECHER